MAAVNIRFPGNIAQVETAADLRAIPSYGLSEGILYVVTTLGQSYIYDPGSVAVDDGDDVIKPNDRTAIQAGRWLYQVDGFAVGPRGNPGGNAMALGLATEVPTLALNAAGTIGNDYFQTAGYSSVGVGAARYYRKAPSEPTRFGDLVSLDGVRLGIAEDVLRPEMFGILGDGTNERARLQQLFDLAPNVSEIRISRNHRLGFVVGNESLFVSSNSRIVFEGGSFENLAHNLERYEMLMLSDVENVTIIDPVLNGRRDLNSATTGEYGNGIQVLGACKNIRIDNPITNNMWGDGIFIGQQLFVAPYAVPQDVVVNNHNAINCRRQGMSIAGGERITVNNPSWTKTNGTDPSCGLDIEPDRADSRLVAVRINSPYTSGNQGGGIMVYLAAMRATSTPVDITITDHVSVADPINAQRFWKSGIANDNVTGSIRSKNLRSVRSGYAGIGIEDWDSRGPSILIDSPDIVDANESNSGLMVHRAGIVAVTDITDQAVNMGNVTIKNHSISETRTTSRIDRWMYVRNLKGIGRVDRFKVIDPVRLVSPAPLTNWVDALGSFADATESARVTVPVSAEVGVNNYASVYSTAGASGDITFTLSQLYPAGAPDMTFVADGTQAILAPDGASAILPGGGLGKTVTIPVNGRVRLRRKSSTAWVIVSSYGSLTFQP